MKEKTKRVYSTGFFNKKEKNFTGEKGFEPLTFGFGDHYSTIRTILPNIFSLERFFLLKLTKLQKINKNQCSFRLVVRTSPFHGENTGSIPVRNNLYSNKCTVRTHYWWKKNKLMRCFIINEFLQSLLKWVDCSSSSTKI